MPHQRRSLLHVRRHGIRVPVALAAVAVLALNLGLASSWASTALTTITGGSGDGAPGFGGDGGLATGARLNGPASVAVDGAGNVVVADTANHRIRRIDAATGVITTLAGGAGDGAAGFAGDGGPATSARLSSPTDVTVDGAGNVVVADTGNHRVRLVRAATGVITTIAGGGTDTRPGYLGDGNTATKARLAGPSGVAVDGGGNVVVADTGNHRIRLVSAATGVITTIAGGATDSAPGFGGDGHVAKKALLASPSGVAVDSRGNVVVADTGNHRVRLVDAATGVITTIAGGAAEGAPGFSGDGGQATAAQLDRPAGVAVNGADDVLIADSGNQRIRRVDGASAAITTLTAGAEAVVAGAEADPKPPLGVAAPPRLQPAPGPLGVAVDGSGVVFVANTPRHRVDKAVAAPDSETTDTPGGAPDPSSLCQLVGAGGTAPVSASPSWTTRSVRVSDATAEPGERLAVEGSGFDSGQQLTVTLCSTPAVLGTITADAQGSYRANVRIPADIAPGAHHLVLADRTGNAALALRVLDARDGTGSTPAGEDGTESDPVDETYDPGMDAEVDYGDPTNPDDDVVLDGSFDDSDDLEDLGDAGADLGSDLDTDSDGMADTGAEVMPMLALAGVLLKLGGALVLTGRRRSGAV